MRKIIKALFFVLIISVIFGTVYVAIQQVLRMDANDPQIQMAEDAAMELSKGSDPASFMPLDRSTFDMSQRLAPFVMIFDEQGTLLESSARLHDSLAVPPIGTFEYARVHGEDRFTWQPENGVRNATILRHFAGSHSGFVLVGRSLREVETREHTLFMLVAFGWLASVVLSFGFILWYNKNTQTTQL